MSLVTVDWPIASLKLIPNWAPANMQPMSASEKKLSEAPMIRKRVTVVHLVFAFASLLSAPLFAQQDSPAKPHHGVSVDWSHSHVLYRGSTDPGTALKAQSDPRILHNWLNRTRAHANSGAAPKQGKGWFSCGLEHAAGQRQHE
jgi:hypothetical protein